MSEHLDKIIASLSEINHAVRELQASDSNDDNFKNYTDIERQITAIRQSVDTVKLP